MAKKTDYYGYLRQELGGLIEQLQIPELYKKSLKQRWLNQVIWADKKAAECRRWHYRLRLITIVGSVILPALVGINFQFAKEDPFFSSWFPYIPFVLSQIIAISAAAEEFCRFGDRWRDYRKMAEDLKAEGWQYLQLSGPYYYREEEPEVDEDLEAMMRAAQQRRSANRKRNQTVEQATHLKGYAMFASRVESIIKDDVQNYISDLVNQQAKQQQQIEQYLESAQSVSKDQSLFARSSSTPVEKNPAPTAFPTTYPAVNEQSNGQSNGTMAIAPAPPAPPPPQSITPPAPVVVVVPPPAPAPPNVAPAVRNLNPAIVQAAIAARGMSTQDGPGGGNVACAWTVNRILQSANIPAIGDNPNLVPKVLEALQGGRGRQISRQDAKAGDLVIAHGEEHIGIGLTDGCSQVLSNSSSNRAFVWESDIDFGGHYGGSSTIYRLLN